MSYAKLFAFTYSKHWDTTSTPQTERACLTTLPTLVSTIQGLLSSPPSHDLNQHHTALHLTTTVNINYSSTWCICQECSHVIQRQTQTLKQSDTDREEARLAILTHYVTDPIIPSNYESKPHESNCHCQSVQETTTVQRVLLAQCHGNMQQPLKIKAITDISIRTRSNTLTASLSRWTWVDRGVSALWCLSHICTHTYACTCIHTHTHTDTHTHTHTHTHTRVRTHTHTCARTHIHTLHANCPLQCYCLYMCLETSINQTHIRRTQVYTCTQHWNDISQLSHQPPAAGRLIRTTPTHTDLSLQWL